MVSSHPLSFSIPSNVGRIGDKARVAIAKNSMGNPAVAVFTTLLTVSAVDLGTFNSNV